ncbi:MAG: hypothetical protein AAFO63_13265, partial [Pseudomonadota bacterium]
MRLLVIAGLGLLFVGIVGAFAVSGLFSGGQAPETTSATLGTPRIAIATSGTMQAILEANEESDDCDAELQDGSDIAPTREDSSEEDESSEENTEVRQNRQNEIERLSGSRCVQNLLYEILTNRFEGQLSGALSASERFDVAEPSSVLAAFKSMAQSKVEAIAAEAEARAAANQGSRPTSLAALLGITDFGKQGDPVEEFRKLVLSQGGGASSADFSVIADKLDVDYFLFVGIGEPGFFFDVIERAYDDDQSIVLRANPFFTYRLFDVTNKRIVYAAQERLQGGLAIDLDRSAYGRLYDAGVRSSWSLMGALRATFADVEFKQFGAVSAAVARQVLDSVSPAALIVSSAAAGSEPNLFITRGSNDGVQVGDEFDVQQVRKDASGQR